MYDPAQAFSSAAGPTLAGSKPASSKLAKCIKTNDLGPLMERLLAAMNSRAAVLERLPVLDDSAESIHPVQLGGEAVGFVQGDDKAGLIADLLSRFLGLDREKRRLAKELLSQYEETETLRQGGADLCRAHSVAEAAESALRTLAALIPGVTGVVFVASNNGSFAPAATIGFPTLDPPVLAGGACIDAAMRSTPEIINNVAEHTPVPSCALGAGALLLAPLPSLSGQALGLVRLGRPFGREFSSRELHLAAALAAQTGRIVEALDLARKNQTMAQALATTRDLVDAALGEAARS